jgi:hypothetical protein
VTAPLADPKLWWPDKPQLYDLKVRLLRNGRTIDEVSSYFGLRSVGLAADKNGWMRIQLNGQPQLLVGVMDQGFWPDGGYTPPTDDAVRYDIQLAKQLGFNTIRKHMKVEPARWYYWCDQLGMLVWQDMPSGDDNAPWPRDGTEMTRSWTSAQQFREELRALVRHCYNAPSVMTWTPFNEGWGQFDTVEITEWLKKADPTRLVISASGGNDFGVGDIDSDHFYFFPPPLAPPASSQRAAVLGECGGLGLPIAGHTWQDRENWGYRTVRDSGQFAVAYRNLIAHLRGLIEQNLSALIYTQLTDVEIEVNGLVTYDREVVKFGSEQIAALNATLYEPLPELSQSARQAAATLAWWRFEGGTPGERLAALSQRKGAVATPDRSNRRNHLYAFSDQTAPRYATASCASSLSLGVANQCCLAINLIASDAGTSHVLFSDPLLSRTHMAWVDRYPFACWTVELSVWTDSFGMGQVLLSKERVNNGKQAADIEFRLLTDGRLQVRFIDRIGQNRSLVAPEPLTLDQWTHAAATCDGQSASLYLLSDGGRHYELVAECETTGALATQPGTWVVGRGGSTQASAPSTLLDEIRISTMALAPCDLLWAP